MGVTTAVTGRNALGYSGAAMSDESGEAVVQSRRDAAAQGDSQAAFDLPMKADIDAALSWIQIGHGRATSVSPEAIAA